MLNTVEEDTNYLTIKLPLLDLLINIDFNGILSVQKIGGNSKRQYLPLAGAHDSIYS